MKVAVPVNDENLEIFVRTGRAPYFAVFEFDGNDFKLVDLRENPHAKEHEHDHHHGPAHGRGQGKGLNRKGAGLGMGRHDEDDFVPEEEYSAEEVNHHQRHLKAARLDECKYLVCRALGPNMRDAVEKLGIQVIRVRKADGQTALEVLNNIKDRLV